MDLRYLKLGTDLELAVVEPQEDMNLLNLNSQSVVKILHNVKSYYNKDSLVRIGHDHLYVTGNSKSMTRFFNNIFEDD